MNGEDDGFRGHFTSRTGEYMSPGDQSRPSRGSTPFQLQSPMIILGPNRFCPSPHMPSGIGPHSPHHGMCVVRCPIMQSFGPLQLVLVNPSWSNTNCICFHVFMQFRCGERRLVMCCELFFLQGEDRQDSADQLGGHNVAFPMDTWTWPGRPDWAGAESLSHMLCDSCIRSPVVVKTV